MAERKKEDVEGYIHEVSDVKTPSSGNRYFDFKIQGKDINRRVVCFSPDKRQNIKENEQKKSPVKIFNVSLKKCKFEPENIEYIMNNTSKVMNISFPWSKPVGDKGPLLISNLPESSFTGDVMSIKAKVIWKGQTERVFSHAFRKDLESTEKFIECRTCKVTTMTEDLKKSVSANIVIVDESGENKGRFHCSGQVLNAMLTSVKATQDYNIENTDTLHLPRKMIVETLLQVKKVVFKLAMDDKLVIHMQVSDSASS
jgi:hypothetical protein